MIDKAYKVEYLWAPQNSTLNELSGARASFVPYATPRPSVTIAVTRVAARTARTYRNAPTQIEFFGKEGIVIVCGLDMATKVLNYLSVSERINNDCRVWGDTVVVMH